MAYPDKLPFTHQLYTVAHADITVATASAYCPMVGQGEVRRVMTVITGAITSADETLTLYKNGVTTTYAITVTQASSAAGDVDYVDIPAGAVTVGLGDYLSVVSSNASGGTITATVVYVVSGL